MWDTGGGEAWRVRGQLVSGGKFSVVTMVGNWIIVGGNDGNRGDPSVGAWQGFQLSAVQQVTKSLPNVAAGQRIYRLKNEEKSNFDFNCRACAALQHTVAVPIPRFQVWGSRSQSWHSPCFVKWLGMKTLLNQSINQTIEKVIRKNILHRLTVAKSWKKEKKAEKKCLDWDSNPRPGNVEQVKRPMMPIALHSVPMGWNVDGNFFFLPFFTLTAITDDPLWYSTRIQRNAIGRDSANVLCVWFNANSV